MARQYANHYALKSPPKWRDPELGQVALLHLTPGLDGVSKAANEAERGMLPPSRRSASASRPRSTRAARPKAPPFCGCSFPKRRASSRAMRRAKSPRPRRALERGDPRGLRRSRRGAARHHIEGFRDLVIARKAYSPADLEALNVI